MSAHVEVCTVQALPGSSAVSSVCAKTEDSSVIDRLSKPPLLL